MRWGMLLVLCGCGAILEDDGDVEGEDVAADESIENAEGLVEYQDDWHEDVLEHDLPDDAAVTDVPVELDDVSTAEDSAEDALAEADVPCAPGVWMCSGVCSGGWFELTRACSLSCGICTPGDPATYNAAFCTDGPATGVPCNPA